MMQTVLVNASAAYPVHIGGGLLDRTGELIAAVTKSRRCAVVTDSNVGPLYGGRVQDSLKRAGFDFHAYTFPAGEQNKNLDTYRKILEFFALNRLTRSDFVIALGGGVAGDMAGFAAATILRGVPFVQIPTTLLSQVDSSVGGKTAIDLKAGKNLAGVFCQPKLVLMDPETLDTLPLPVFMDGMAEVVKYGCIWDEDFFHFLAARPSRQALMADIEHILYTCCDIKRKVVMEDELDTGLRMILNFGHTLGHAYELAGHYEEWSHGEAVAAGMCAAARLGVGLGITPADVPGRIEDVLGALGQVTRLCCSRADYAAAIGLDKKGAGADITLILLDRIGRAVPHKLPKEELLRLLDSFHNVP